MKHFTHRRTLPDSIILEVSGTDASTPDLPPFPKPDPEPPIGGGVVVPKKPSGGSPSQKQDPYAEGIRAGHINCQVDCMGYCGEWGDEDFAPPVDEEIQNPYPKKSKAYDLWEDGCSDGYSDHIDWSAISDRTYSEVVSEIEADESDDEE